MAAHAPHTSVSPALRPIQVRRPRPQLVLALAALLVAALVALAPSQVAAAAHDACTYGNPEHVTCGEALVLLGYP